MNQRNQTQVNSQTENEITRCVDTLRKGGIVLFPSETGWTMAGDAAREELVKDLLASDKTVFPALYLDDLGRLNRYCREIPEAAWTLIEYNSKPLQFFMEGSNWNHSDIIPFCLPNDEFTSTLLKRFGKPLLMSTLLSQNHPEKTETVLNRPCYVVNLRARANATTDHLVIMRFGNDGHFEFIRKT